MPCQTFSVLKTPPRLLCLGLAGLVLLSGLAGCSGQAAYMRGWEQVEKIEQRWHNGTLITSKLSADEAKVQQTLGTPQVIRFFRVNDTRQTAYEWIYPDADQTVWFVDGKRVEYVTVDANTSWWTREQRDTLESKLTTGGILGAIIGGGAAGVLLYGDKIGLRDVPKRN